MSLIAVFLWLIAEKQNSLFWSAENGLLSGISLVEQVSFFFFLHHLSQIGETIISFIYRHLVPERVFSFGIDVFVVYDNKRGGVRYGNLSP